MALEFAGHLAPDVTVYDCMDELSAFRGAPPGLLRLEQDLLNRADLVFTGGRSLYEAKRDRHPRVFCFPSSIDAAHFGKARAPQPDPADQAGIPRPRIGFFGVVDERMDLDLVRALAERRPDWRFVMIGPVAKIDTASLPRLPNLHWLGGKRYADLPAYLSGWDAGFMPFALNESTRFISPTKTPEFLAAGLPVVSTPVLDVVRDYGEAGLVEIAEGPAAFADALARALSRPRTGWLEAVDRRLAEISWDRTWDGMRREVSGVAGRADARAAGGGLAAGMRGSA
jgi:glycosyltransferase involved in cell wall biosynthesis